MQQAIRRAAFAGSFYPGTEPDLKQLIRQVYEAEKPRINLTLAGRQLIGGIVPHAGYVYSAWQAVHFYALLKRRGQHVDTVVIINPNHTGYGSGAFNSSDAGWWETPLGRLETDEDFIGAMGIVPDYTAHAREHSGEVQLPLLQYFCPVPFRLAMITMNRQTVESANLLAQKIFQAKEQTGKQVLVIASSDFSHYETPKHGFDQDQYVIDQILSMDVKGIFDAVKEHQVSACGYGPIMTLVAYSGLVTSHPKMSLLSRGNSGDVHPSDTVVDYASFVCYES